MRLFDRTSTKLERRRRVDRAWQRYVQDGIEPEGINEEIWHSWRRARESYRIDPALARPDRILTPDALGERSRRDAVLRFASPILRDFSCRLGLCDHVLAYFDGDGWMLSIDGDRDTIERVDQAISFRPGVNWAEESVGTNGAGTALITGKPIEVFASEHYVSTFHEWSCAAAPVRSPGASIPVGVVDIMGPWEVHRRQALLVTKGIARAIEERLRAAMSVRDEVVRYAMRVANEAGDALVAVDLQGRVLSANEAAARRRIVDAGVLAATMRDALATTQRAPGTEAEVRFDLGEGPTVVSMVRHEGTPVGAIVRVGVAAAQARRPRARSRPAARYDFGVILGRSDPIRHAVELARTASRNELPVVLYGESGTGKELFAQAIHSASARQSGPFVPVNCGCIPAQLLEAELFGYEAGTYTGAKRDGNAGRFEDADGGTLFLDEVSELPLPAQTALLRVLQEKEVVRLGGSVPRSVDVRVLAATNKPLDEEIRARRFRSDLYYRLNVLTISVPPLRERGPDDILLLARVFLAEAESDVGRGTLSLADDAVEALRGHRWPGNVRELKNVILRAAVTARQPEITARDLLLDAKDPVADATEGEPANGKLRDAVLKLEKNALVAALDDCTWNFTRAADQLGISRMTLYRWARKYGISRTPAAPSASSA